MSQSSDVVVIDIGSRMISAYGAERLSDDNFAVKTTCEIEYEGYRDGRWLKGEEVIPSLVKLVDKLERGSGKIKSIYVGIPADFCVIRTVYDKMVFPKAKRITSADIQELYEANDPFCDSSEYTRIHADAAYFMNDKGDRMRDPIGTVTSFLKCQLSYVGAESRTLSFLRQGLMRQGIKNVRFLQSEFVSALSLFGEEERDGGVIVADIGYLVTSVAYVGGDAVLDMKTFSLGGSLVPTGLSHELNIPFRVAAALASKVNLGFKEEGEYSLKYDAQTYSFPVSEVNRIVEECVRCVMNYVQKAIRSFRFEPSPYATVFLTGGGFSEIRFAREYASKCLGRSVETVQPTAPNFAKPYYSTAVGLLRAALAIEKEDRFGFVKKLFRL